MPLGRRFRIWLIVMSLGIVSVIARSRFAWLRFEIAADASQKQQTADEQKERAADHVAVRKAERPLGQPGVPLGVTGSAETKGGILRRQAGPRARETTCPRSGFAKNVITFLDHYSAWIAAPAVHRQISIRICHNALRQPRQIEHAHLAQPS